MHHPTDRITHTTIFVTPVVEHWLEREIAQWVHPMKDRSDNPPHHERTLLPRNYISLPVHKERGVKTITNVTSGEGNNQLLGFSTFWSWFGNHKFIQSFHGPLKAGKLHHGVGDLSSPERHQSFVNSENIVVNKLINISRKSDNLKMLTTIQ